MTERTKDRNRQNARRRGSDFEKRIARRLDGFVWPGEDGDVEAAGYRIECKYRNGLVLQSAQEFLHFHQQVQRYKERPENAAKPFIMALSGGASADRAIYFVLDEDEFLRLVQADRDRKILEQFRAIYPDIDERIRAVVYQLADELNDYWKAQE